MERKEKDWGFLPADLPEPEPTKWIIKDFLASGMTLIGGPSGSGKSTFLAEMLISVVTGQKFLGKFDVEQTGDAVYIDVERFENTRYFLCNILKSISLKGNYRMIDRFLIDDKKDLDSLISYLFSNSRVKLVIIDSLLAAHISKENSNEDMMIVMKKIREIQDSTDGAAIVLLQHTKKSSKDSSINKIELFRGATSIGQVADAGFIVSSTNDFTIKKVETAKFNYVSKQTPGCFFFRFQQENDLYRLKYCTEEDVNLNNSLSNRLILLIPKLLQDDTLSTHEIFQLLRDSELVVSRMTLHRALRDLESSGVVYQPKHGFYKKSQDLKAFDKSEGGEKHD